MNPHEMPQQERIANFQCALLELLAQSLTPQEIQQRLENDAAFAPYAEYVATFELRMIEVAAELTKKWGRRDGGIDIAINDKPEERAAAESP